MFPAGFSDGVRERVSDGFPNIFQRRRSRRPPRKSPGRLPARLLGQLLCKAPGLGCPTVCRLLPGLPSRCRFLQGGTSVSFEHLAQEFLISFKMVHDHWASKKITHDVARELAMRSRSLGSDKLVHLITWIEEREQTEQICRRADALRGVLVSSLGTFRPSPKIVVWQGQYIASAVERMLRYMALLLRGRSKSGKTRKAINLFGHARSLVVNCQGLGANLPSLRAFSREKHKCIIFDECNSRQVLPNKLVFQAGVDPVTLGQSACNSHAYKIWLHAVPMILCSNDFQMVSNVSAPLSSEEVEWLAANIIVASLLEGEAWHVPPVQAPFFNAGNSGTCSESDDF